MKQKNEFSATIIIYSGETKKWYKNGKLHRDDGPAVEYSDGYKEWFLNGEKISPLTHIMMINGYFHGN